MITQVAELVSPVMAALAAAKGNAAVDALLAAGRRLNYHNDADITEAQARAQNCAGCRAEAATAQFMPFLKWQPNAPPGRRQATWPDLGDCIDVKGTQNPHAEYLISPASRDLVDDFAYVLATPCDTQLLCWILCGWQSGQALRTAPLIKLKDQREKVHAIHRNHLRDMLELYDIELYRAHSIAVRREIQPQIA